MGILPECWLSTPLGQFFTGQHQTRRIATERMRCQENLELNIVEKKVLVGVPRKRKRASLEPLEINSRQDPYWGLGLLRVTNEKALQKP
jgi:hypothetical protein